MVDQRKEYDGVGDIPEENTFDVKSPNNRSEDPLAALLGMILIGVGMYVGIKLLKKFLTSSNLSLNSTEVSNKIIKLIENNTESNDLIPRLDRAEELLNTEDKFNIDMAALMVGATLEKALKIIANSTNILFHNNDKPTGAVEWALALNQSGKINSEELSQIRYISGKIRNRAAHGDFNGYDLSQVNNSIQWIKSFVTKYLSRPILPSSKECFIATAVFGNELHPDVIFLKKFRDLYLTENIVGKYFVLLYYKFSPPIASYLTNCIDFKTIIRAVIHLLTNAIRSTGINIK